MDKDYQIQMLFNLYDSKDEKKISKKDFLKMLYSYPRKEMEELFMEFNFDINFNNSLNLSIQVKTPVIQSTIYKVNSTSVIIR